MTRTWPALVALGVLLTTGCGADGGERADPEPRRAGVEQREPDRSGQRPPREAREVQERRIVAPREKSEESTPPDPLFGYPDADAHLLAASALGTRWSVSRTYDEKGRLASGCQRASLVDIGASLARLRDFQRPRGVAVQAVAEFADRASARRADAVLLAWRDRCADRLEKRDAALGTVRHGEWVSLVEVTGVRSPERRLAAALTEVRATF
jgi:hypothetical protein